MAGQRGLGTTIEFEKTDSEQSNLIIGNLTSIGEVGADADEIDVTTLDSTGGYREFIPGFKDAGEVALSGYFIAGKNHDKIIELFDSGESRNAIVAFPSGAKMTFPCFVKSYKVGPEEVDGAVGFSASLRVTGKPVLTESAGA